MTSSPWTVATSKLTAPVLEEMADIAASSIHGYSDDRPVDARLVRSRLYRPSDDADPVACLAHDQSGRLVGWVALRRRDRYESHARLWGPVVAASHRRQGIGAALLASLPGLGSGAEVMTTDVPHDRPGAIEFFQDRPWTSAGDRAIVTLDRVAAATTTRETTTRERSAKDLVSTVNHSALGEFIGRTAVAHAAIAPSLAPTILPRWERDHRFRPDLVLGHPGHPCLLLLLPQTTSGASELLFAELWAEGQCARDLIRAGLRVMETLGSRKARAVTEVKRLDPFTALGFRAIGNSTQFIRNEGASK